MGPRITVVQPHHIDLIISDSLHLGKWYQCRPLSPRFTLSWQGLPSCADDTSFSALRLLLHSGSLQQQEGLQNMGKGSLGAIFNLQKTRADGRGKQHWEAFCELLRRSQLKQDFHDDDLNNLPLYGIIFLLHLTVYSLQILFSWGNIMN